MTNKNVFDSLKKGPKVEIRLHTSGEIAAVFSARVFLANACTVQNYKVVKIAARRSFPSTSQTGHADESRHRQSKLVLFLRLGTTDRERQRKNVKVFNVSQRYEFVLR